jgi:molybdopterin-guanine dinucleotide biosynthesis protein A
VSGATHLTHLKFGNLFLVAEQARTIDSTIKVQFFDLFAIIILSMLSVVVQAGGESRRMGQDKALVAFLGRPLIQSVIERLAPLADEVLITTNRPEDYEFLGYSLFQDLIPGRGALGGLYTALSAARQPLVAVVACDMPFVSAQLLEAQRELLVSANYDAVIPRTEGGTEPFHAVYRRLACIPAIQEAINGDKWRVDAWYSKTKVYLMPPQETAQYDPQGLSFWNVNTPEELLQAEEIARRVD